MIPLFSRAQTGAVAVMVAGAIMADVAHVVVPGVMWPSTYVAHIGLAVTLSVVTLSAARNARPTGSLGQLLYQSDHSSFAPVETRVAPRARSDR